MAVVINAAMVFNRAVVKVNCSPKTYALLPSMELRNCLPRTQLNRPPGF